MVRVKVCGLTNWEDVICAVESGADVLGFVRDPSSQRFVADLDLVKKTKDTYPDVPVCAVYGLCEADEKLELFDWVQSVLDVDHSFFVKALRIRVNDDIEELVEETNSLPEILLDAYKEGVSGGTGEVIDWGFARRFVVAHSGRVTLAGGLGPENVAEAVRLVKPYAVDACSKLEKLPGVKDHLAVRAYVENAKSASSSI